MNKPVRGLKNDEEMHHPHLLSMPGELGMYIQYLLIRLANRWNADQNRDLSEFGVNGAVLRTLSVLYINKTMTVNEIAAYTVVEQSNASRTIDAMVTAGLVERQIAETDLRRREIALTGKGEKLLRQLWPLMMRRYEGLIGDIPAKDVKVCATALLAMIRNVDESGG